MSVNLTYRAHYFSGVFMERSGYTLERSGYTIVYHSGQIAVSVIRTAAEKPLHRVWVIETGQIADTRPGIFLSGNKGGIASRRQLYAKARQSIFGYF